MVGQVSNILTNKKINMGYAIKPIQMLEIVQGAEWTQPMENLN
jgi:hypothetical protein